MSVDKGWVERWSSEVINIALSSEEKRNDIPTIVNLCKANELQVNWVFSFVLSAFHNTAIKFTDWTVVFQHIVWAILTISSENFLFVSVLPYLPKNLCASTPITDINH